MGAPSTQVSSLQSQQRKPPIEEAIKTATTSFARDEELSQLNELVKNLLSEQQALKDKVNQQEQQLQTFKASGTQEAQLTNRKITKKPADRSKTLSNVQSTKATGVEEAKAERDRKRKVQQAEEQAKIEAIEAKIEIARKRIEEKKSQKSQAASKTV